MFAEPDIHARDILMRTRLILDFLAESVGATGNGDCPEYSEDGMQGLCFLLLELSSAVREADKALAEK